MKRRYPDMPIAAMAGVVCREGRVLLGLRRNPPSAGRWSVPGGVQEVGETTQDAVKREVREETGLQVTDLELLDVGDVLIRDDEGKVEYHYTIVYYLGRPCGGALRPGDDVREVRWFSPGEVQDLQLPPRLMDIIREAFRHSEVFEEERGSATS